MASTTERQRAYRQRRLVDGTDSRLSMVVNAAAAAALARLARYYGQTQRQTIENMLASTEAAVVSKLEREPEGSRAYFEAVTR